MLYYTQYCLYFFCIPTLFCLFFPLGNSNAGDTWLYIHIRSEAQKVNWKSLGQQCLSADDLLQGNLKRLKPFIWSPQICGAFSLGLFDFFFSPGRRDLLYPALGWRFKPGFWHSRIREGGNYFFSLIASAPYSTPGQALTFRGGSSGGTWKGTATNLWGALMERTVVLTSLHRLSF